VSESVTVKPLRRLVGQDPSRHRRQRL